MVATDHACTATSRRVLKQFVWGRGPRKNCFGCLEFASTCGKLRRQAAPPAGEHARHWGAVGRAHVDGLCTVEVQARLRRAQWTAPRLSPPAPISLLHCKNQPPSKHV